MALQLEGIRKRFGEVQALDGVTLWVTILSQVPFVSPFMMLSRVTAGEAAPWEVILSMVILVVSLFVCLRIAARLYAAGVLLYGQRPSVRAAWRIVREPR